MGRCNSIATQEQNSQLWSLQELGRTVGVAWSSLGALDFKSLSNPTLELHCPLL